MIFPPSEMQIIASLLNGILPTNIAATNKKDDDVSSIDNRL